MGRRLRLLVAVTVVVSVAGGVWAATRSDAPEETFCAGVGLITATRGLTPEAAFEAWAHEQGYDPDAWVRSKQFSGGKTYSFEPRDPANNPSRLSVVLVEGLPSDYRVTGGCV